MRQQRRMSPPGRGARVPCGQRGRVVDAAVERRAVVQARDGEAECRLGQHGEANDAVYRRGGRGLDRGRVGAASGELPQVLGIEFQREGGFIVARGSAVLASRVVMVLWC